MSGPPYLRPFWRYYGGKWMSAPRYPAPRYSTIIEPFAGAAGYSLRHYRRNVVLVERYPVIAEIWRYLIASPAGDIRAIPCVDHVEELPDGTPQAAKWLVGMCLSSATIRPKLALSAGMKERREAGKETEGWSEGQRARVAAQVDLIRHWRVIEGDYSLAPPLEATWFIDPPYVNKGRHYVHGSAGIDFAELSRWCRARAGQVIVCEAEGADWLPFRPLWKRRVSPMSRRAEDDGDVHEVVWTSGDTQTSLF